MMEEIEKKNANEKNPNMRISIKNMESNRRINFLSISLSSNARHDLTSQPQRHGRRRSEYSQKNETVLPPAINQESATGENPTDAITIAKNPIFSSRTASQQSMLAFYQTSQPSTLQRDAYTAAFGFTYILASAPTIIPVSLFSGYAKEIGNLEKLYKNDMKYEKMTIISCIN